MQKLFVLPLLIFAGQLCLGQTLVISHPAAPATGLGPSTPLRGGLGGTGLRLNLPPGLRPDGGNAEAEIAPGSQVNLGLFPQARLPQSDVCAARRGTLEIRPIGAATLMEVRVDVCLAPTVVLPDNLPLGPVQAHFRTESGETLGPAFFRVVPMRFGVFAEGVFGKSLLRPFLAGQTLTLRGTGLGRTAAAAAALRVEIGGKAVRPVTTRTVQPGIDEVTVVLPEGVPQGCNVPVRLLDGARVLQVLTLPIGASAGTPCVHAMGLTRAELEALDRRGPGIVSFGLRTVDSVLVDPLSGPSPQIRTDLELNFLAGRSILDAPEWPEEQLFGCALLPSPSVPLVIPVIRQLPLPTFDSVLVANALEQFRLTGVGVYQTQFVRPGLPSGSWKVTATGGSGLEPLSFEFEPPPLLRRGSIGVGSEDAEGFAITWPAAGYSEADILGATLALPFGDLICVARASSGRLAVPLYRVMRELGIEMPGSMTVYAELLVTRRPDRLGRFSVQTTSGEPAIGLWNYVLGSTLFLVVRQP